MYASGASLWNAVSNTMYCTTGCSRSLKNLSQKSITAVHVRLRDNNVNNNNKSKEKDKEDKKVTNEQTE